MDQSSAPEDGSYITLAGASRASCTVERSEFVARAYPVDSAAQAQELLAAIRKANPKARHTAWAYVLADGEARSSDDGEPSGTAGLPVLQVLHGAHLRAVALFVTRFFGGVLLGTGGLVRAYTKAARLALEDAPRRVYERRIPVDLHVPYALYNRIMDLAARLGGTAEAPVFAEDVQLCILFATDGNAAQRFMAELREISAGSLQCSCQEARMVLRPAGASGTDASPGTAADTPGSGG